MRVQGTFVVALVGVVSCVLAAPNPGFEWNDIDRKLSEWGQKINEMKDKAIVASQSICNRINSITPSNRPVQPYNPRGFYQPSVPSYPGFQNGYPNYSGYYPGYQPNAGRPGRPLRPNFNRRPIVPPQPDVPNVVGNPVAPQPKEEGEEEPRSKPPSYIPPKEDDEEEDAGPDFGLEQDDMIKDFDDSPSFNRV